MDGNIDRQQPRQTHAAGDQRGACTGRSAKALGSSGDRGLPEPGFLGGGSGPDPGSRNLSAPQTRCGEEHRGGHTATMHDPRRLFPVVAFCLTFFCAGCHVAEVPPFSANEDASIDSSDAFTWGDDVWRLTLPPRSIPSMACAGPAIVSPSAMPAPSPHCVASANRLPKSP